MVKQSESFFTVGFIYLYVFLVSSMAANTCSAHVILCLIIPVVLTDENKLFVSCGLFSRLSSSDYIER
jgi:hypothetical protein